MEIIFQVLSNTPKYVYGILFYLIYSGIKASKNRVVLFNKVLLSSGVITYLSFSALIPLQLRYFHYFIFLCVLISFGFLGWVIAANQPIQVDRKKKLIALPGSWITLILVFIIFTSKYYLGFRAFHSSTYVLSLEAKVVTIFISGFSIGIVLGKLSYYLSRFISSDNKDLSYEK